MANVRCPMCSKLNPPEAETCAYCGARIKPAGSSPVPPPASAPGDDEPDWLRQLRVERPDEQPEGSSDEMQPGAGGDEDMPDWLSRIRDRAKTETGEESSDTPDWMKGLQADETSGPEQGEDDWLRGLSADLPADLSAAEPTSPEGGASDEDWISKLSDWQSGSVEPPLESGEQLPNADFNWLDEAGSESEPKPPGESSGFGLTGFLSEMSQPPQEDKPTGEAFDWSADEDQRQPDETSPGFGLTGFLSQLSDDETQPDNGRGIEPGLPDERAGEGALPDWGRDSTPSLASQPEGGEEMDWLKGLGTEATPTAPDDETGLPDWLLGENEPAAQPPASSEGDDLPGWLAGAAAAEETPTGQAQEPAADDSTPEWLSMLGEPTGETPSVPEEVEPAASAEIPAWLEEESGVAFTESDEKEELSPADAESLPDWFASFDQADLEHTQPRRVTSDLQAGEPAEAAEQPAEISGEIPDWLQAFQDQPQETAAESALPLPSSEELESAALPGEQPFTVDLPDWLDEDATARTVEAGERPAEPVGEDLAQADLPEWVKDMRPIDSMIPAEAQMTEMDQRVEKSGPLAGMRGVLPAEEIITRWRKLPVYSVKLKVTEKQRSQSSLLDSILKQESQPLLIPPARPQAQGLLLRAMIALLLVIVLTIPFLPIVNMEPLGVPVLYPAEMLDMFDTIDRNLQPQAPVLLAVDYQPALSREMNMASAAVIDQLMSKNARIVVVSTVPTGPALAQQLLAETSAAYAERTQTAYNIDEQTINLGYLPGGTISLLEFAQQPQRAAPSTLAGAQAWNGTFLEGVNGLAGFSQILVITDSGETGRAWVEQVQPWMGDVPLFMVTSAQAAPLMAPYVESNQVAGMVSGLLGGAMYARLTGQTGGSAFDYLAAYQVGIVLAMALILVGGLVSGILALMKRNNKQED